jgi:hypothetical protein
VDARRECNGSSEKLSRCRCGDQPGIVDQPLGDADSKMREEDSRSAVEALRTRLAREDFAVHEGPFLDRLDSTRGLDAVVRALCDRLGDFIPALYHDLIPYGEQQRALAKRDTDELKGELKGARTKIAGLRDDLAGALVKVATTQRELSVAQDRLAEAANHSCEDTAMQQEATPRVNPWWPSGWTTRW